MTQTNPRPLRRTGLSKLARFLFYASPTRKQLAQVQVIDIDERTLSYCFKENSETSIALICITNGVAGNALASASIFGFGNCFEQTDLYGVVPADDSFMSRQRSTIFRRPVHVGSRSGFEARDFLKLGAFIMRRIQNAKDLRQIYPHGIAHEILCSHLPKWVVNGNDCFLMLQQNRFLLLICNCDMLRHIWGHLGLSLLVAKPQDKCLYSSLRLSRDPDST